MEIFNENATSQQNLSRKRTILQKKSFIGTDGNETGMNVSLYYILLQ